jgi:hypothetical protein
MSDPTGPKTTQPGTWEPPPPTATMMLTSGGFGAAAFIAMLLDACDIGAVIAFVFGLVGVLQIELWYSQVYVYSRDSARSKQPPAPSQLVAAAAAAFDLAAVIAILTAHCKAAMVPIILAVLLDLVSSMGRSTRGTRTEDRTTAA